MRTVDLGSVNGRCFTFASGVGLDASVVQRVDANPHMKARLGAYFFTWVAISTFTRRYLRKPPRMEVCVGGQTLAGVTAIVQNGSTYTYFNNHPIDIAEGAALDSGTLAGGVLRRATPLSGPSIAWRALSTRARVTRHRQVSAIPGGQRADGAHHRRPSSAAPGRWRLPRRCRRGALLDPAARD